MICLYNGNYEDHDLSEFYAYPQSGEKNIERMKQEYAKYPGTIVGDFTCIKVEYDWGHRDQRWTVKCNKCGQEMYQYHIKDWRRGKGRALKCKNCAEIEKQKQDDFRKLESEKTEKIKKERIEEYLGKVYKDWKIIEYNGSSAKCKIQCTICGKTKTDKIKIDDVISCNIPPCNHKKQNDYSGKEWIGKRNGHLTTVGRDGSLFRCKCDCGREITARPVELFTRKTKKVCGDPNCQYSSIIHREYQKRKKDGISYEEKIEKRLIESGYNAKATKGVGDYGVDIIIINDDNSLTAVQCKYQTAPAGVRAIQEVYAGGRFYDCTNFAVICEAGFSNQAIIMARKLGVYLCDGEFDMPSNIDEYTKSLIPTYQDYQKPTKQKTEKALMEVQEFQGTFSEICKHFGVIEQTVKYRMKQKGMTLEDAVLTPKETKGRPSISK